MDWRKELNLQKVSTSKKSQSTSEDSGYQMEHDFSFEENFEKPKTEAEEKFQRIEASNEAQKDLITLTMLGLTSLGLLSLIATGNIPAKGMETILGIDLYDWWFGSKLVALTGLGTLLPAALKLRGRSAVMDSIFNFLPNKGRYRMKELAVLGLGGLMLSQCIFIAKPEIFKNASEWRILESMQMDSIDPELRKKFKLQKEIISISPELHPLPSLPIFDPQPLPRPTLPMPPLLEIQPVEPNVTLDIPQGKPQLPILDNLTQDKEASDVLIREQLRKKSPLTEPAETKENSNKLIEQMIKDFPHK